VTDVQPVARRPPISLALRSLLRADFAVMLKNRRAVLLSLLLPVVLLLTTNSSRATAKLGGALAIIGLCIAYGLAATGIMGYGLTVARDRDQGVFQRLRVTPTPTWAVMSSRLLVQATANLLIAVVVVVIGSRLHHLGISAGQYALVLVVSILGGAVFLAIGQALVGLTRSADTVNAGGRILFAVLIFLGLFGASGALGGVWESISRWSPVGVVMRLFVAVIHPSQWNHNDTLAVLACCAYVVVCAAVGIRWFHWDPR
jgi:ABC-2 type transport system permease protein